ncbi:unnamed protein product [Linum trigynum]|uniref:Uncharacterized protein n=1 Tax=Linum trigynum TaxID=586398 RepID=A0AAV2CV37_9ROSI
MASGSEDCHSCSCGFDVGLHRLSYCFVGATAGRFSFFSTEHGDENSGPDSFSHFQFCFSHVSGHLTPTATEYQRQSILRLQPSTTTTTFLCHLRANWINGGLSGSFSSVFTSDGNPNSFIMSLF